MSLPAQKARSPAPVRITTRTRSSSLAHSAISTRAIDISSVTALSFSGRFNVMIAVAPSSSSRMFSLELRGMPAAFSVAVFAVIACSW